MRTRTGDKPEDHKPDDKERDNDDSPFQHGAEAAHG
jgi:hypothetical protein